MEANVVTPMLTLFRSDEPSYQPLHPSKSLQLEDGNPQASLENLKRLGLVVQDIWVRKGLSRVLIQFTTGEQYLALGLGKAGALAFVASKAGFGELRRTADVLCLPAGRLRRQTARRDGSPRPAAAERIRRCHAARRRGRPSERPHRQPLLLVFRGG